MAGPKRFKIWISLLILLVGILACNMPLGETTDDAQTSSDQQSQSNAPSSDRSSDELGMTRSNPYPIDAQVSTSFWDFKVLEVARGEDAWQIIQAENPENPPPPPGKEYFLVKVEVRCKNPDPGSHL